MFRILLKKLLKFVQKFSKNHKGFSKDHKGIFSKISILDKKLNFGQKSNFFSFFYQIFSLSKNHPSYFFVENFYLKMAAYKLKMLK